MYAGLLHSKIIDIETAIELSKKGFYFEFNNERTYIYKEEK